MIAHYGDMELGRKDEDGVREFYRTVPPKGDSIGPKELQKRLEIEEPEFEKWKRVLQEHELIGTVQRGGIKRLPRGDDDKREADYYKPLMRELRLNWAERRGREYHLRQRFLCVLDTSQGGRAAHGRWTRPDITLLGGKVLPYLPGKFLDVVTFEVKLKMPIDGLYEALAHRRRANFAYIVCIWPERDFLRDPLDPKEQAAMVAEATRQGVGVILVRQEDDIELWDELVEPVRHEPDPQHLHDFLEDHCKAGALEDLRDWLRRQDDDDLPDVTDDQLQRLSLTTEELRFARKIMEMIKPFEEDEDTLVPTKYRELANEEVRKQVRKTLKEANYIDTTQGGGIKKLLKLSV